MIGEKVESPSLKQVEDYIASQGKRASNTLSILGRLSPFVEAMNSEIGRELLKDDVERHEELLIKIYNENNVTPQDLAEFRYLKKRIKTVYSRFHEYVQLAEEVRSGGRGKEKVAR